MTSHRKEEGDSPPASSRRPGENGPTHLPPEVQQAKVVSAKNVEEEVVEPIQQHREGRRRPRKPPAAK